MKLAFSTLGCPDWELAEVIAGARKYGYDGVELRALSGSLDLLVVMNLLRSGSPRPGSISNARESKSVVLTLHARFIQLMRVNERLR
jgi:sugar phosphate isomerase/epimerase